MAGIYILQDGASEHTSRSSSRVSSPAPSRRGKQID